MQALCLAFSAHAASRGYSIAAGEKIKAAEDAASSARSSKRRAERKTKEAEQKVAALEKKVNDFEAARDRAEAQHREDEEARRAAEEACRAAEEALAVAQREHARFVQEELPRQLEEARRLGWEDYQKSDEFEARIAAEYRTGFLDMKAGFHHTNPHIVGVDWSFAPEESEGSDDGEAAMAEGGEAATPMVEEGEVAEDDMDLEDMIILDEPDLPAPSEQPDAADQPPAE